MYYECFPTWCLSVLRVVSVVVEIAESKSAVAAPVVQCVLRCEIGGAKPMSQEDLHRRILRRNPHESLS
jgi:hypothetical protein